MQRHLQALFTTGLLTLTLTARAQISLDGTLGKSGALPGPNYQIGANLGQQQGGNLFHSFRDFNLQSHESATFSGPINVQNVISRVTGGNPSSIDGTLRSTIPNANLYFLNPFGIMFGPNAKLDVQGSFHASTADTLRLQDGGQFHARVPSNSLLTVAPPSAFGFVSDSSTPLTIDQSKLSVPTSKSFSIVGGELQINQAQITAPSGRINLASVASKGEVTLQPKDLILSGESGNLSLSHSQVTTTGPRGGDIYIRAGQFEINDSSIQTDAVAEGAGTDSGDAGAINIQGRELTLKNGAWVTAGTQGTGQGGNITIDVAGPVTLSGESSSRSGDFEGSISGEFKGSLIGTHTFGKGPGGTLSLNAQQLSLANGAHLGAATFGQGQGGETRLQVSGAVTLSGENSKGVPSRILADARGASGNAGLIELQAGQLTLQDGAGVTASTAGTGQGGNVTIDVSKGTITLTGASSDKNPRGDEFKGSVIGAYTTGKGDAGNVKLAAGQLSLRDGAKIGTATFGEGQGGTTTIKVSGAVTLSGENSKGVTSGIIADARSLSGRAGLIELQAGQLTLQDGAGVTAFTMGTGKGGNVVIDVPGSITLMGESSAKNPLGEKFNTSMIGAYTTSKGDAGNVNLTAGQLSLRDGAKIGTATFGEGQGGTTTIKVLGHLTLDGKNSKGIASTLTALSQNGTGKAGDIIVQANTVNLTKGGTIATSTDNAAGGDIIITTPNLLYLQQQGQITTSVKGGTGNGGNITINKPVFVVLNQGQIKAQADQGKGGNIDITSRQFLKTPQSLVSASSRMGINGTVVIRAPNETVSNSLNLPPDLIDVTNRLPKLCRELSEEEYDNLSHFFVHRRAITGPSPSDLQGSSVWFLLPYFRTATPPSGKVQPPARQGQEQVGAKPWLVMMECQKTKTPEEKKSAGRAKTLKVRQPQ
jgi:filamentous hemagglutinin family protein